ncbi:uncharacterized protein HD556DRAFT_1307783 [Suillus plorans]|uniref:Uncharacterized protein n=1 Tax=Suillus plorans TaxID=116603 RepID=A0A9P7AST5_9AGAM|nr:uncharacterized protein HD556DRAFT_1307783 [Suillus plorans]KAG1794765.1 hypothetical protein HD556DRAFT_1307783 [Suillus plorans]
MSDEDTHEVGARKQDSHAGEGRLPASPANSDLSAMVSDEDPFSRSGSRYVLAGRVRSDPSFVFCSSKVMESKASHFTRRQNILELRQIVSVPSIETASRASRQNDTDGVGQPMEMLRPTVTVWLLQHGHCDRVAASTTAVAPLEPERSWSSAPELWGELPKQLTAIQPPPQAVGSSSHSNVDSFTADFFQSNVNESSTSVPRLHIHGDHDDNLGYHHGDPYDRDYRPTSAHNVNVTNDPYHDHNNYGRSQRPQPDLPVQAPVIQNPPSFFQNPPNLSLWPIHHSDAHEHVSSSSHVNLPPAIEAPPHAFDIPLNIVDKKMNRGRKVGPQYHTAASGRRSNSKCTSVVQPGSLRVIQVVILPPQFIDQVKEDAHAHMVKFTFENSFFLADETLTHLANHALDTAVAQYSNTHRRKTAELNKWRKCIDAKGKISRLRSVPTTIIDTFRACGRLVVFVAYELALPVTAQRRQSTQSARIDRVESLLLNDSFLDGFLEQFLVPLANRAITNILEIMLSEQQYGRYIFDGTDKWRLRLSNTFFLGGTTYHVSRFDPTERSMFDGLLDNECYLLTGHTYSSSSRSPYDFGVEWWVQTNLEAKERCQLGNRQGHIDKDAPV